MALLKLTRLNIFKTSKLGKSSSVNLRGYSQDKCQPPTEAANNDMPIQMENPYAEEKPQCILCKYDIEPSYKNVRLLSQFTSKFTGKIYGRYITGLCKAKQEAVEKEIKRAQSAGLMGHYTKNKNYLADPVLYDITKPFKVL